MGARAAGIRPVLLDESDLHPGVDCDRVASLDELVGRIRAGISDLEHARCVVVSDFTDICEFGSWTSRVRLKPASDSVRAIRLALRRDERAPADGARHFSRRRKPGLDEPRRHLVDGIAAPLRDVHQEN